ncbi:MAG: hypothetical protein CMF12_06960 [Idiomarina sp.]|uniref:glycosyltransferase family 2 protein n=1 Tax=Idiomarina sp. TaxID=1874361 RepID=UPI000C6313C5|nr:glycosyltransferase [Idiomarina sp.]MBT42250.1 hypothetical protein [Idiomarina sp.]
MKSQAVMLLKRFKRVLKKRLGKQSATKDAFINVDFALVNGRGNSTTLVLLGWMKKTNLKPDELRVFNQNSLLTSHVFSYSRDDVAAQFSLQQQTDVCGFIVYAKAPELNLAQIKLVLGDRELVLASHRYQQTNTPAQLVRHVSSEQSAAVRFLAEHDINVDDIATAGASLPKRPLSKHAEKVKALVANMQVNQSNWVKTCQQEILPKLQDVWKQHLQQAKSRIVRYGESPGRPKVSVIIPLYGRYDFMRYQLSTFSADTAMQNVELIYVLDDPELEHEVAVTAHGLAKTFPQPFSVVFMDTNVGFGSANNHGAAYAQGELLLLLNSDIIPRSAGWLDVLCKQYESTSDAGVLGATLLYEDESIQHCGMVFTQEPNAPGITLNHHPHKGVPLALVSLPSLRKSLLTTGACMLMRRELFEQVGGFDRHYVIGDFEDSDLCLSVAALGYQNYVSGVVTLFHLERLSQRLVSDDNWKQKLSFANACYQQQKWGAQLADLEQKFNQGWESEHA